MVWVILGPLAVQIAADLHLTPARRGLCRHPAARRALLQPIMGVLVDHLKPRMAGLIGQIIVLVALAAAWFGGVSTYREVLLLGAALGVAGASFAVALPLVSRWYPPQHQGTAMGIAGAGNSGTVFAALFSPPLAVSYGWNSVFGLAVIPLAVAFVIYALYAKDSPECPPAKSLHHYLFVLQDRDAWWFMFFYSVTFGGFVGLAQSLTIYFNDQYGLDAVTAGYFTAACVFAGSLVRPVGGMVADRIGGIRALLFMYTAAASMIFIVSFGLRDKFMALSILVGGMLALGMGNGAVFQLVPQRFRKEIGVMTGLVGMAGGIGGFYLASSLGYSRQLTGSSQLGLLIFAGLALLALFGLSGVKSRWRTTWGSAAVTAARV